MAAPASSVDAGGVGLGIAISGWLTGDIALAGVAGRIGIANLPAIGGGIGVIPGIAVILVVQVTVCSLDLPDKAGDIILNAGPWGSGIDSGLIGQRIAVGIELGEAETGMAVRIIVVGEITAMGAILSADSLTSAVGIIARWIAAAPVDAGVVEMPHKWWWWCGWILQ